MGANFDLNINVSVTTDSPSVGVTGFGTVIHVTDDVTFPLAERIRFYESPADIAADSDLGATAKEALNQAFAVSPRPSQVAVGQHDIGTTDTDYKEALDAILAVDDAFFGVTIVSRTASDIQDAAEWCATNLRIGFFQSSDADMLTGAGTSIVSTLQSASNDWALVHYHADDTEWMDVAWLATFLATDVDVQTTIAAYRRLSGITVDSITTTEKNNLLGEGGNAYLPFKKLPSTYPGKTASGQYVDTMLSVAWVKARVEEAIAQELVNYSNRGSKIPYNDEGIQIIASVVEEVLDTGVQADHFNIVIDEDTGEKQSPQLTVPLRSEVSAADVTARTLNLSFVAELAGAIQETTVTGNVVVDL